MAAGKFVVELEQETDGRWIAEVVALPGVVAYGDTREKALAKAEVLALRVLVDRLEHSPDYRLRGEQHEEEIGQGRPRQTGRGRETQARIEVPSWIAPSYVVSGFSRTGQVRRTGW